MTAARLVGAPPPKTPIALAGCAVTEKTQPEAAQNSGFLQDYSQLKPGDKEQAGLVYWNPNGAVHVRQKRKVPAMIGPFMFTSKPTSRRFVL